MKWLLIFTFFITSFQLAFSQNITVLDQNSKPLSFAHILVKGKNTEKLLLSDVNGKTVAPSQLWDELPIIIEITYIGFHKITDTIFSVSEKVYNMKPTSVNLSEMVVTAQYSPENADNSVHKVKVINRKKIEAMGAVTLRDVLQNETNLRISQDNILGSSMNLQGISGENVKILIDGVPVIGRLNGNIDLSQINLNNIERIEIVEGPLSVNYGTDALAGTINLITKKDQKEKLNLSVNSYYETVGQYNLDFLAGVKIKKSRWSLSGGRNYFDGWSPEDKRIQFPEALPADTNRYKQWNPKEQFFAKIQYSYFAKKTTIRPYVEYFSEEIINRGFPRPPYNESAFDDKYFTTRKNGGIDVSKKIKNHGNIVILAAYNNFYRTKNTYFNDLTTLEKEITDNPSDQDTSKFDLWMSRGSYSTSNDSAKINYEIGYDVNYETAFGKRIEGLEKQQGDYALYTSAEYMPFKKIIFRPGLRLIYNTAYRAPVVPSLNIRYNLKSYTVRASYAKGFRAPSLKELYFEFIDINHNIVGSQSLEAENSDNFQFSLSWQKVKAKSILKLDGSFYFNNIKNLITLAQSPENNQQYTYVNIGNYKTLGSQANMEVLYEHIRMQFGGAYIGRYNSISDSLSITPYSFSPEFRSNIIYDAHKWNLTIAVIYKYSGKIAGFITNSSNEIVQTSIEDYHMLDFTITKNFWKKHIQWVVGCKNILDVQNINSTITSGGIHSASSGTTPVSWGRTFFTSLKININK